MERFSLTALRQEIKQLSDPDRAKVMQRYFKTGKGEYGEGDVFVGLSVPQQRILSMKYKSLSEKEILELLKSVVHEERLIAVFILVQQFKKATVEDKERIAEFYLKNLKHVNNWDIVDSSAHKILGPYLADKDKSVLLELAKSDDVWKRRVAVITTSHFIANQKSSEWIFKLAVLLLNDEHDLIHKAVGWMLREVGDKISQEEEIKFLDKHYRKMPRTMLRYAIEKFTPALRAKYMAKN